MHISNKTNEIYRLNMQKIMILQDLANKEGNPNCNSNLQKYE